MVIRRFMLKKIYGFIDKIKDNYFNLESENCLYSDRVFVPKYYYKRLGKKMNVKNPKLFSEKLNWLKIYYHDPLYTICADKYRMREYVNKVLGEGYTVPLLGKWDKAEDIDFNLLPDKFVLKTNHDGCPIICTDKSKLDIESTKKLLNEKLKKNFYARGREWAYKNIKRLIFAEEFLETNGELIDYRFFCFNGSPKIVHITSEHTDAKHGKSDYFDVDFNLLPFHGRSLPATNTPVKPENYGTMVKVAKKLSEYGKFPFVRVDMYNVNGKIYIGELTFYPSNGMVYYEPTEWNEILGSYLILPKKNGWKREKRDKKWMAKILKRT